MGRQTATYKKMPGRWLAPFTRRTLWQGPDHLLWVEKTMMLEHYRRFYFKDIQAVIVCRTRRQHLWTLFWALLVLVTGSLALPSIENPDLPEFFVPAFFTLLWGIGLLVNLFKGPCCEFYLQTAVQLERLSHMVREKAALKVADRIKELAEKAQGSFQGAILASAPRAASGKPAGNSLRPEEKDNQYQPQWHWALFGVLLCQGGFGGLQLWLRHAWVIFLLLVTVAAALVLVIIALVQWHRQIKGSLLALLTWVVLIFSALHGAATYGLFLFGAMRYPQYSYNAAAQFRVFLELYLEGNTFITALVTGFAAGALALGGIGLLAVAMHRGRYSRS